MTATHTTATLADEFETTPRELRKFLRSLDMGVGKGARYSLPASKREVAALRKKFTAWATELEAAKNARQEAAQAPAEAIDDAPEGEPTDADLEAIENEG